MIENLCEKISCLNNEHQGELIKAASALADIYPQGEKKETCLRRGHKCEKPSNVIPIERMDFKTGQRIFKKILIVEDDKYFRESLKLLIACEHPEYTLIFAPTGKVALELIADFDNDFDCVFIDIILPDKDLNGIDVLKFLKHCRTHTPVCIMSASSDDEYIKAIKELGTDFLHKPFDPQDLLKFIALT